MNKDNSKEKLLAEIERLRRAPMPHIFDNIEQSLLSALRETIQVPNRADFCVGTKTLQKSFVHAYHVKGKNDRSNKIQS